VVLNAEDALLHFPKHLCVRIRIGMFLESHPYIIQVVDQSNQWIDTSIVWKESNSGTLPPLRLECFLGPRSIHTLSIVGIEVAESLFVHAFVVRSRIIDLDGIETLPREQYKHTLYSMSWKLTLHQI
jgi:hypothetical protein